MNRLTGQVVQLGVVLGIVVIFVDFFFSLLAPLDWLALTVSFGFAAVMILDAVVTLVPKGLVSKNNVNLRSEHDARDDFQDLEDLVEGAVYRHQRESIELLTLRLRSVLLSAVAARTRLTKSQIRDLTQRDIAALAAELKDRQLAGLLGHVDRTVLNPRELDALLSKIEDWSL